MSDHPAVDYTGILDAVREAAIPWLDSLRDRPVRPDVAPEAILERIPRELPGAGLDPLAVVGELTRIADGGLIAMGSPRFHGWVIGGALPAALAADWLTSAWDQNTAMLEVTPVTVGLEHRAGEWLKDLLDLPRHASVGFVTGGQMANWAGLAVGRDRVLDAVGWDVRTRGLQGGPRVTVLSGAARHSTVGTALRYLGLGSDAGIEIEVDDQDRMRPEALDAALAGIEGPVLVIAAAGSIHAGDLDPIGALCDVVDRRCRDDRRRAWVHVDGAIGLWGRASRDGDLLARMDGLERADSWSTDGHKWLNTPYDCGVVITADPAAHERSLNIHAAYIPDGQAARDSIAYVPEMSRRARGVPLWAALRQLGRDGVADLVDGLRARAREYAEQLAAVEGVEVLHEVVLNQVTVRFRDPGGDDDGLTRRVVAALQAEGTVYPTPSEWKGGAAMRISVSNWQTTAADVTRGVAAIERVYGSAS